LLNGALLRSSEVEQSHVQILRREARSDESWFKAIGTLTAAAMSWASILCGTFSGGWLLCGGAFWMTAQREARILTP